LTLSSDEGRIVDKVRYFSFDEFDGETGWVSTVSEVEVRETYYPYWYDKMCAKFGKEHVDANYSFEECLEDWKTVHWAWEVDSREVNSIG
jgi:hypothetical protein